MPGPGLSQDKVRIENIVFPCRNRQTWRRPVMKHTALIRARLGSTSTDYSPIRSRVATSGPSQAVSFIPDLGFPIWPQLGPWQNFCMGFFDSFPLSFLSFVFFLKFQLHSVPTFPSPFFLAALMRWKQYRASDSIIHGDCHLGANW